jgi:hypothetical protein
VAAGAGDDVVIDLDRDAGPVKVFGWLRVENRKQLWTIGLP